MITQFGVFLIGLGALLTFLLAIYIYSIRINSRATAVDEKAKADKNSCDNAENSINSKKNKKQIKENARNQKYSPPESTPINSQVISPAESNESFVKFNEEDDILALASLKGYDTTGIRRRLPEKVKAVDYVPVEPKKSIEKVYEIEKENSVVRINQIEEIFTVEKSEIFSPAAEEIQIVSVPESNLTFAAEEWSQVPTREEEVAKNLKNKVATLEVEIEESERKLLQSSRLLEQTQKRVNLLEQELKEQRKLSDNSKATLEAQLVSLRAINHEMAGKLMTVEADGLNFSLMKNESERAKEANARLQTDLRRVQEEKNEIFRQFSELKTENSFLREQAYLTDSLKNKCVALEEELEEARRQMDLQIETSQTELKLTRAKLESEIAFHRAEHANSVGSSTALHQEIAQLKSEISNLTESENKFKAKAEEFERLNSQLLNRIEELESESTKNDEINSKFEELKNSLYQAEKNLQSKNDEISNLQNDLKTFESNYETIKSKLITCETEITLLTSEISNLKSQNIEKNDSNEILNLRNQLAEAEIKISSLQSELNREIKRADIAKKVYESKLAMLEKN